MTAIHKMNPLRDRKYLDWIQEQPCVLSGQTPCDPAHIRIGSRAGKNIKPGDDRVVPLAHHLHMEQHRIGEKTFWRDAINTNDWLLSHLLGLLAADYRRKYLDE